MEAQQDFKELLALFNERKIDYITVGAHAVACHGAPRFTGDLNIWRQTPITSISPSLIAAIC